MKTTTFLTFVGNQCGKAKEAIDLYMAIFPHSKIIKIIPYNEGEAGGTPELIKFGVFTLNGTEYMVSESNYNHAWNFSPAISIYIESQSEVELQGYFEKLSSNGGMVMRSEEHTSELQSLTNLVCRLLLEKKKQNKTKQKTNRFPHTRSPSHSA